MTAPTILDRRCECGSLLLWSAGVQGCASCDEALTWTTNDRPRKVSRADVLWLAAIIVGSWVPVIALVAWWWHR